MFAQEKPRSTLLINGFRFLALAAALALLTQYAPAVPDRRAPEEPATTVVRVAVPAKLGSFQNRQLEVVLYAYDPRHPARETQIDIRINKGFNHRQGAETTIDLILGANASIDPARHYYVTVAVFDPAGKRTLLGEVDGKRGLGRVLTGGKSNRVAMIIREARGPDAVMDIADEIKKGNNAKAVKMAQARAKDFEELLDVEELYGRRKPRGIGWGAAPGVNPALDGIQAKLLNLQRAVPANFLQDAENNEEAAYWIAALAELAAVKPEFKPAGRKSMADWAKKAGQLRVDAEDFAKAIAAKDAAAVKDSAQAVLRACYDCHLIYKE